MYLKAFEVRWSDLDANRHLANSAYLNFMSHTRMSYMQEHGLGHDYMVAHQLGPVVFYEHIYYFREVLPGVPLQVSLEFMGMSADGMFFEFHHNFYNDKGQHMAHCEMMGAWIDLETRKLTGLPVGVLAHYGTLEKAEGFRVLTKEDTRKFVKQPKDLA